VYPLATKYNLRLGGILYRPKTEPTANHSLDHQKTADEYRRSWPQGEQAEVSGVGQLSNGNKPSRSVRHS